MVWFGVVGCDEGIKGEFWDWGGWNGKVDGDEG